MFSQLVSQSDSNDNPLWVGPSTHALLTTQNFIFFLFRPFCNGGVPILFQCLTNCPQKTFAM